MIWINLNVAALDSAEFIGCSPVERATWLCLLRYCVGQENGGRVRGCRQWKDRQWQQLVRVTQREAVVECGLWTWDGDDLVVWNYPVEKEAEVRMMRELGSSKSERKSAAARENGARGGRPKTERETQREHNPAGFSETQGRELESGKEQGKEERMGTGTGTGTGKPTEGAGSGAVPRAAGGDAVMEDVIVREAPCTEEEAWAYAAGLSQLPLWTKEAVEKWFATREASLWMRGGGNPVPISRQTWRADLRSAHHWAVRTGGRLSEAKSRERDAGHAPDPDSELGF